MLGARNCRRSGSAGKKHLPVDAFLWKKRSGNSGLRFNETEQMLALPDCVAFKIRSLKSWCVFFPPFVPPSLHADLILRWDCPWRSTASALPLRAARPRSVRVLQSQLDKEKRIPYQLLVLLTARAGSSCSACSRDAH